MLCALRRTSNNYRVTPLDTEITSSRSSRLTKRRPVLLNHCISLRISVTFDYIVTLFEHFQSIFLIFFLLLLLQIYVMRVTCLPCSTRTLYCSLPINLLVIPLWKGETRNWFRNNMSEGNLGILDWIYSFVRGRLYEHVKHIMFRRYPLLRNFHGISRPFPAFLLVETKAEGILSDRERNYDPEFFSGVIFPGLPRYTISFPFEEFSIHCNLRRTRVYSVEYK